LRSVVRILKQPKLSDPVLVEGVPGIGFVANIASLQMTNKLKATKVAEIRSPYFQDLSVSDTAGFIRSPFNEIHHAKSGGRDLLILYGNTQALTSYGQYELYDRILDLVQGWGCRLVVTLGGMRRSALSETRGIHCATTNEKLLQSLLGQGANPIEGNIVGAAGLLLGLAKLRGIEGFCILVETLGTSPDPIAASIALDFLNKFLKLEVSLENLQTVARIIEENPPDLKVDVPPSSHPGLV